MASTEEKVMDLISSQLGVSRDQITRDTHFANDLGTDSLDIVELIMAFEDEFDIDIPDDAAEKIETVGQVIDFIDQQ